MKRYETPMTKLRRRVAAKVSRMTVDQLVQWQAEYNAYWLLHRSIISPAIKTLTDGLNSQSINAYVVRRVYDEIRKKKFEASRVASGRPARTT